MNLNVSRNQRPLIERLSMTRWFMRTTALLQVFCYLFVFLSPAAQAAVDSASEQEPVEQVQGKTDEERLGNALQKIKENVAVKKAVVDDRVLEESDLLDVVLAFFGLSSLQTEGLDQVEGLFDQVQIFNQQALENFRQVESSIAARGLPAEILQRHHDTVAEYEASFAEFRGLLEAAVAADSLLEQQTALEAFNQFLQAQKFKREQQSFDPADLPTQVLQPDKSNLPKTTQDEFIQSDLRDNPPIRLAALGDLNFDQLEQADDPAYLAETDEIVITQAIRDLAEVLEHDAVKIYHWVRNNIEWIPGWGAVQNADLTLSARRGNAMDIASLTIALLRASQIPSRYVHGTIEVPGDAFMNWMGGFTSLQGAADYASSNGIPVATIISGGQIGKIQMEHVWVEAATDFYPSRGEINLNADIWLELDPSFKQYEFPEIIDGVGVTSIDLDQVAQDFIDSGELNADENWATGFDLDSINQVQAQLEQDIQDFIDANDSITPTIGDLFGGLATIVREFPGLPSALPNRIVIEGARYGELPAALQQRMTWGIGRDLFGQPRNAVSLPFSRVNNEQATLSFRPATASDEAALEALLPEGDILDIDTLPDSIPSYLIRVIPELKLNGQVISSGSSMRLGEEVDLVTRVEFVGRSPTNRSYSVIAGSYLAVNAYSQTVSPGRVDDVEDRLSVAEAILDSGDPAQIEDLGREDSIAHMFHMGGLSYYGQLLTISRLMAQQDGRTSNLAAGIGTIGYEPNINTFFGIPRSITTGGVYFNIPLYNSVASLDGDRDEARQFTFQIGLVSSALEHLTPEQLFASDEPTDPDPNAISAVKAFKLASEAGQRVYQVTAENQNTTLPLINHDSATMQEIRNAVNSNHTVVTHTDSVSVPGWSGAGYIILDLDSGSGAYKISGGANGSFLKQAAEGLDKVIGWLSNLEKVFNKPGPASIIKKAITKVKKAVQNIKALIDIALACNPGFALLGVILYLIQVYIFIKITLLIIGITTALCAAFTGPFAGACAVTANVLIVWNAIDLLNKSLESTAEYITEGCSGG